MGVENKTTAARTKAVVSSCFNCARLQFGFSSDPSWDACDYVCQDDSQKWVSETRLFCTHGLSKEEVAEKLKAKSCERWKIR